ncbi:MAG: aminoglycoside adenylyltransferase [Blastocatellia bacterium]|nr:MAG: aminoglycoside adenylyltransferase [Blastocatellia bacterium]
MRTEVEMLDLIVSTAKTDDRIRAVIMNGSRVNPNAPKDIFQDFDIVYFVTHVESFTSDHSWIDRFGEMLIQQMPETMKAPAPVCDGRFSYLMQFTDGNRIDLTLFPIRSLSDLRGDSLSRLLLDKDGAVGHIPEPTDRDYIPEPPTAKAFFDCCNEFWWVCPYVAKGLWREEIIYAKYMLDQIVRSQLMIMLNWYLGAQTQVSVNPGNHGKYLKKYLEPELWSMLEKTYSNARYDDTWDALFIMCDLFRRSAKRVAVHFGFEYLQRDDDKVTAHLKHIQALPKDAMEIY